MEIATSPQAALAANAKAETTTENGVISSDFETFLRMLTAQLNNQDPLNPMESADYAVQLATFSSVEQQVLTNSLLTDLSAQIGASGATDLAAWVGLEARVSGPGQFSGNPLKIGVPELSGAPEAMLVVKSDNGNILDRRTIDPSTETVQWDGKDASGSAFPFGKYTFEIETYAQGKLQEALPAEPYLNIVEARRGPTGVELVTTQGQIVKAANVSGVRERT